MPSRLNPYISFGGNAREAMEFYKDVFGGELSINTFADFGQADTPFADKIMHGQLETSSGFTLMAADTPPGMEYNPGDNVAVSLSGDDEDELRGYWDKLSRAARSPSRWRSRCGATCSACAPTASASAGWSTSASRRPDPAPGRPPSAHARAEGVARIAGL